MYILTGPMSFPGCDSVQFCKMLSLGELGEGYMGSLCIISYNFMWLFNYLEIKGLLKNI